MLPRKAATKQAKKKLSFSERLAAIRRLITDWVGIKVGAQWLIHYRYGYGRTPDGRLADYNAFTVSRGYLTLRINPVKWFDSRITMDTYQDDRRDWKVRLKYLHGKFILPYETKVVSEPFLKFGIVEMPWLDFEEHINRYRMQGTMFTERQKLFNSADLGITVGTLLGPKLPAAYQRKVNSAYPGTYGSLAVGVYNGGGYHAIEKNRKKVFEGRISLRPLLHFHPNLQLSYFIVWGQGNIEDENSIPDWRSHVFMVSYEHQYLVATAQLIMGKGIQAGEGQLWIDVNGNAAEYMGASGFLEVKLPWIWSGIIARYDWFDGPNDSGLDPYSRIIAGWAFHFWGRNKNVLLLDFDYSLLGSDSLGQPVRDIWALTLTLQIKL